MSRRGLAISLFLLVIAVPTSNADELRPAYIELTQKDTTSWSLLWKASAQSRLGRDGQVLLPVNCQVDADVETKIINDNVLRQMQLQCSGTLSGETLGLSGLEQSSTDALVRIKALGADTRTLRLTSRESVVVIPDLEHSVKGNVVVAYTVIGVEHIVFGFDHFFFVLALVLLLTGWQRIAWTVTAFTLAHSITLVGTTLNFMSLPQRPVEAVIALSIVFLAVEIIKSKPNELRLSEQFPWLVAFSFGLLHGFGFAGALAEIGLPRDDVPMALLSFNIGVELGQLMIVAGALLMLAGLRRVSQSSIKVARISTAYTIGSISMFWLLERMI